MKRLDEGKRPSGHRHPADFAENADGAVVDALSIACPDACRGRRRGVGASRVNIDARAGKGGGACLQLTDTDEKGVKQEEEEEKQAKDDKVEEAATVKLPANYVIPFAKVVPTPRSGACHAA